MVFLIGLTGGIGSGKSTAAHYFSELGVPVIDADNIARKLCEPQEVMFQKIKKKFGETILDSNGKISRRKLRKIIFYNPTEQSWLEKNLHPLIIEEILQWAKKLDTTYGIIVAPLLFETTLKSHVNRTLVIDSPREKQIKRVVLRDKTDQSEVEKILSKQLSREERLKMADDVVVNDAGFEELRNNVMTLHNFYSSSFFSALE